MITLEEALQIISTVVKLPDCEIVDLENLDGRILAENIYADRDYPPFNRAAMDGYGIRLSDWKKGIRNFTIKETIYAGQKNAFNLSEGTCYKIMTGAAVPLSANAIIRLEDSVQEGNNVLLHGDSIKLFQNIAAKGEDCKRGDLILTAPVFCTAQVNSLLATTGTHKVTVKKLPEVSIITTGNEIVSPEDKVSDITIRNSNQILLKSLLKAWNIKPVLCIHVPDKKETIKNALEKAVKADITIINGGVSAGDADFVPEVLESIGVRKLFHKVQIKPGKPIWCGTTPTGGIVFALPGNPLSCLTAFTIFVETYLYKYFGFEERPMYKLPLMEERNKKNNLTEFFPVGIEKESGKLIFKTPNGSGDIRLGLNPCGIGVHPKEIFTLQKEEQIYFYPFKNSFI